MGGPGHHCWGEGVGAEKEWLSPAAAVSIGPAVPE